jgi:hypothetical protein
MDAACPAARPFLAFTQFLDCSLYPARAGRGLLGIVHPADELVSA